MEHVAVLTRFTCGPRVVATRELRARALLCFLLPVVVGVATRAGNPWPLRSRRATRLWSTRPRC
eukprot:5839547-Lingulodinium_polyedra.AAC.1